MDARSLPVLGGLENVNDNIIELELSNPLSQWLPGGKTGGLAMALEMQPNASCLQCLMPSWSELLIM